MLNHTNEVAVLSACSALTAADNLRDYKILKLYKGHIGRLIFNWVSSIYANDALMNCVKRGSPIGIAVPREHSMSDTPLNRVVTIMRRQEREFRQQGANHRLH